MQQIIHSIKKAFPQSVDNKCIQSCSNVEFDIYDPVYSAEKNAELPCRIVVANEGHFHVKNINGDDIGFIAIDHCIWSETDGQKCDCALFNDRAFWFIEIKMPKNKSSRKKLRNKAISQIRATVERFFKARLQY